MTNKEQENIENIERAILGMILLSNISIKENMLDKGIKSEFFYLQKNKKLFSVMETMQAENIHIDLTTLISYITSNKIENCGDNGYIASLTNDLPSTANSNFYINQFIDNYKKRITQDKISELYKELQTNNTTEIQKELDLLIQELNDLNNNVFNNLTIEDYEKNNAFSDLCEFVKDLENKEHEKPIKTGFNNLDKILDGGLFAGLYSLGAISSAGKTTLCLQIADQIAKAGNDVLIFSLEMAKKELLAKSLSRTTYQLDKINAVTTRHILSMQNMDKKCIENFNNALQEYGTYSKNIFFNIGIGDIGTEQIRKIINTHIKHRNKKPVVFIDYLQIIAPPNERLTDKQVIDRNIVELKRISRDFNIPLIAISSFNRTSYKDEVNLSSFKESGAIEYTADVLLGLQPLGMNNQEENNKKIISYNEKLASDGKEIAMELKILKYRTGAKGKTIFKYLPKFELYRTPNETREELLNNIKIDLDIKNKAGTKAENVKPSKKETKTNHLNSLFENN